MKLTPEQKVVLEYGKALGRLEKFREEYRNRLAQFSLYMRHYWRKHSKNYREEIILKHDKLVRDAWKKRAAFRAWVHIFKRNCENCKYFSKNETEEPCVKCSGLYEGLPEYWEPRKEEENETDS